MNYLVRILQFLKGKKKTNLLGRKLEKHNTYFFAYFYDAPDISPDYKVLGELEIGKFLRAKRVANRS